MLGDDWVCNMLCFETKRLQVKHLTSVDLDDLTTLCNDPQAMRYMDSGEPLSREICAHWINICQERYRTRGYGTSAVFARDSGAFVGFCGVIRAPENNYDEIIYAFYPAYWGRGYATEVASAMLDYVFDLSQLEVIYATIHADNSASQKMMPKLNMTFLEDRIEEDGAVTKVYCVRRDNR